MTTTAMRNCLRVTIYRRARPGAECCVKAYVGVTDGDWYRFLSRAPTSGRSTSGARGRPRLSRARRRVSHSSSRPTLRTTRSSAVGSSAVSPRCGSPRRGNSSAQATEWRASTRCALRVGRYRRQPIAARRGSDHRLRLRPGHRFFAADAIADPPPDFAPNIVQGKGYDLAVPASPTSFAPVDGSSAWRRGRGRPQRAVASTRPGLRRPATDPATPWPAGVSGGRA